MGGNSSRRQEGMDFGFTEVGERGGKGGWLIGMAGWFGWVIWVDGWWVRAWKWGVGGWFGWVGKIMVHLVGWVGRLLTCTKTNTHTHTHIPSAPLSTFFVWGFES
jgi:hypothetical protein